MSSRIRGKEALITIVVDGELQTGSFFKVKDFRVVPRTDLVEEDYIGELTTDLDIMHHGYDGSFSVDNQDASTLRFLDTIVLNEELNAAHPVITIRAEYTYREPGELAAAEVYSAVVLKVSEQAVAGRKEYVTTGFEWKAKTRQLTGI